MRVIKKIVDQMKKGLVLVTARQSTPRRRASVTRRGSAVGDRRGSVSGATGATERRASIRGAALPVGSAMSAIDAL